MLDENPELIQPENWTRPHWWSGHKTPVILFHDGGGTTFAYHCLDPIDRFVYGVHNPHFYDGENNQGGAGDKPTSRPRRFVGGLPGMAAQYISWIKETIASSPDFPVRSSSSINGTDGRRPTRPRRPVDVLLGGWSLGGLTSLEVARQLVGDPDIRVKGILMIDSVCPVPLAEKLRQERRRRQRQQPTIPTTANGSDGDSGSKESDNDQEEDEEEEERQAQRQAKEAGMSRNQILAMRAMREARRMVADWDPPRWDGELAGQRPPMMLIRAREPVSATHEWSSVGVDSNRADRYLGWSGYDADMFLDVLEVEGHHFNMFDLGRIPVLSAVVAKALAKLDSSSLSYDDDDDDYSDDDGFHAGRGAAAV